MTTATAGATITKPTVRTIRVERTFNASRDRVWRAYTDPTLLAQWWGRGHQLDVVRDEQVRGGHWRYVEHTSKGAEGFEGRYREVTPQDRIVRTFEWDGMPAHVIIESLEFQDLGDGRTRIVNTMSFHTPEERDGMLSSGMEGGMNDSFVALDQLLTATT